MTHFLYNVETEETLYLQYVDGVFVDESKQAVFSSVPVPGDLDNIFFSGLKSPQSSFRVHFDGEDAIDKITKLKSFVCNAQSNSYQIINISILNIPTKAILITSVSSTHSLSFVQNNKITRSSATVNYIEAIEEKSWFQNLLGLSGNINVSTLPPDSQTVKLDGLTVEIKKPVN